MKEQPEKKIIRIADQHNFRGGGGVCFVNKDVLANASGILNRSATARCTTIPLQTPIRNMVLENPSHTVVFHSDLHSSFHAIREHPHHALPTLAGNLIHIHSQDPDKPACGKQKLRHLGKEVREKQEPRSFAFVHLGSWMAFFFTLNDEEKNRPTCE